MLKSHIPAEGFCVGLEGTAKCGRYAHYQTGDHKQILREAKQGGEHWCKDCLKLIRRGD